jgi:hypothetical protein
MQLEIATLLKPDQYYSIVATIIEISSTNNKIHGYQLSNNNYYFKKNIFLPYSKKPKNQELSINDKLLIKIDSEQFKFILNKEEFPKSKNVCDYLKNIEDDEYKTFNENNLEFFNLFSTKNFITVNNYLEIEKISRGCSFYNQLNLPQIKKELSSQLDIIKKFEDYEELSQNLENITHLIFDKTKELQQANADIEDNKKLVAENKKLKNENKKLAKESIEFKALKDFHDQNLWINPLKSAYEKSISNSENFHQKTEQLTDKFFKKISNQLGFKQISEDFIHTYLLSLFTSLVNGRFLLLTGHIGTGKSSLIKDTGPLLGGDTTLIPVRPGWIDSSDLLGFYDPIKDKFRATEFTTAIQQPNNDQINIILLDEMNIARIENYAADILSCHNPIGERKNLNLYQNDLGTEQHIQLAKTLENLNLDQSIREIIFKQLQPNSNHEITLNDNLLLCGTLNIDGSTENLPPKMIDRSFMLKFPDFDGSLSILKQKLETMPVSIQSIVDIYNEPVSDVEIQQWKQFNSDWISPFHDILLPISHRVAMDYILFQRFAKKLKLLKHIDIYFVYSRVLPRLQFTHNPDLYKKANDFINKLSPISGQKSVLSALKSYEDKDGFEVSYQHLCG